METPSLCSASPQTGMTKKQVRKILTQACDYQGVLLWLMPLLKSALYSDSYLSDYLSILLFISATPSHIPTPLKGEHLRVARTRFRPLLQHQRTHPTRPCHCTASFISSPVHPTLDLPKCHRVDCGSVCLSLRLSSAAPPS